MIAGVTQTLRPAMERLGLVKSGELDPASMADELREEVGAAVGTVAAPPMVGAWARV